MKIYARIKSVKRGVPNLYEVEHTSLVGAEQSGLVALDPGSYSNEGYLLYKLKQQLIVHLNAIHAPQAFNTADIVLFG